MTIELTTDRLILRPFAGADVDRHAEMMLDPDLARFLTESGQAQSREEEWRGALSFIGHWAVRGYGFFSVFERESGDWVGRVGPWNPEGWPGLEVGWAIRRPSWGRGYAPEAAVASMRWVFERQPALERILSLVAPDNTNSAAVARKVGEVKTGEIFHYGDTDIDIWAAERSAWLKRFGG